MMSNVNNQFKELINEAIHNHFHDKTKTEMILKDWLYGICEQADEYEAKAKAWDNGREAVHDQLQHILHNTDTSKIKFGFIDGMYSTLDILEETYEKELSNND